MTRENGREFVLVEQTALWRLRTGHVKPSAYPRRGVSPADPLPHAAHQLWSIVTCRRQPWNKTQFVRDHKIPWCYHAMLDTVGCQRLRDVWGVASCGHQDHILAHVPARPVDPTTRAGPTSRSSSRTAEPSAACLASAAPVAARVGCRLCISLRSKRRRFAGDGP